MNVLVLSPHTDDGELGCGGTIARLVEEGHEVNYAAFSFCGKNELVEELREAAGVLKINKFKVFNYEVRNFDQKRQQILDQCIQLKDEFCPTHVFIPSRHDLHQDHNVVYNEAIRAFKHSNILAYEMPWNNLSFEARQFFRLKQEHIEKKIEAVAKYISQMHRPYVNNQFLTGLARVRGVQCGAEFAECFDIVRIIS